MAYIVNSKKFSLLASGNVWKLIALFFSKLKGKIIKQSSENKESVINIKLG